MVSTITPNSAGAPVLGADPRYARNGQAAAQPRAEGAGAGDRVELGGSASWSAARDSVRNGLAQVHQALAMGREAQAVLTQVLQLAGGGAQAQLGALLAGFEDRLNVAVRGGAKLLAGETLAVGAEPGALPVEVSGLDLQLKDKPSIGDPMQVRRGAQVDDSDLPQAARASLDALLRAMDRLAEATRALEAHQRFLGVAEGAGVAGVRTDLDADAARLLALQVRQGLDGVGGKSIANFEPHSVLSLFRS